MSEGSIVTETAGHVGVSTTEPSTDLEAPPGAAPPERPRSLGRDAWLDLRRNPIFIIAGVLILFFALMAAWPSLFTSQNPDDQGFCQLSRSRQPPSADAWFGYDVQGCDIYTLNIYGARASILVGVFTTLAVVLIGCLAGMAAGFYGRMTDSVFSRLAEIFFGIPLLLGAIVFLSAFPNRVGTSEYTMIAKVCIALAVLGWPYLFRVTRSQVIQVKHFDFVQAARALGARNRRIIFRHVLPNALAPVIVVATISLGVYIGLEATLTFLGIGLQEPAVSWGQAISAASVHFRTAPHMLFFPAGFLALTILSFIMLGDAVRDALDPRLR